MGIPQEVYYKIMMRSNHIIRENAQEYFNLGHPWEESMAVTISNFYDNEFLHYELDNIYDDLIRLCEKRIIPEEELAQIILHQISKVKFKALELDRLSTVGNEGYSWFDRLSSSIETIYKENNALYLACNNVGVPKETFYEIFLNDKENIKQRIKILIRKGEIEDFISDENKNISAIVDIYYENISELL
jgi:hypothetical protein